MLFVIDLLPSCSHTMVAVLELSLKHAVSSRLHYNDSNFAAIRVVEYLLSFMIHELYYINDTVNISYTHNYMADTDDKTIFDHQ